MTVRTITVTCMNEADRQISQLFIDLMYASQPNEAFKKIDRRALIQCRAACNSVGLQNPLDQADVSQQAMIELFERSWKTYDGTCSIFTYVYGIARLRAIDLVRKRRRQIDTTLQADAPPSADVGTGEEGMVADAGSDPVLNAMANEQKSCISMAIDELYETKPRWAEILSKLVDSDQTQAELAELFKITHGSFRNLLGDIRRYFAVLCQKHCGTPNCSTAVTG